MNRLIPTNLTISFFLSALSHEHSCCYIKDLIRGFSLTYLNWYHYCTCGFEPHPVKKGHLNHKVCIWQIGHPLKVKYTIWFRNKGMIYMPGEMTQDFIKWLILVKQNLPTVEFGSRTAFEFSKSLLQFWVFIFTSLNTLRQLLVSNSLLLLRFLFRSMFSVLLRLAFFLNIVSDIFYKWQKYKKRLIVTSRNSPPFHCQASMCGDQKQSDCSCRGVGLLLEMDSPYSVMTTMGFYDYHFIPMGFLCALGRLLESLWFSGDLSVF